MALKDTWKDLVDSTTGYDGDDASAKPINDIAHAVIELERNGVGGLTEAEVVEIIRENAQKYVDEDVTLPPSVECMLSYVENYCSVYGDDIASLRNYLDSNFVMEQSFSNLRNIVTNHTMKINGLESSNGAITSQLTSITGRVGDIEVTIGDMYTKTEVDNAINNAIGVVLGGAS